MSVLVHQIRLCVLHADLLQVVIELLIAEALGDVKLMRVPILRKDLLDVVLVHAEVHEVNLSARLADKSAVGDIGMCRLPLIAVNAVGVELVISDQCYHQCSQLFCLGLLEELEASLAHRLGCCDWRRSVRVRCNRLLALLLLLQVFSRQQLDTLESIILILLIIHF